MFTQVGIISKFYPGLPQVLCTKMCTEHVTTTITTTTTTTTITTTNVVCLLLQLFGVCTPVISYSCSGIVDGAC